MSEENAITAVSLSVVPDVGMESVTEAVAEFDTASGPLDDGITMLQANLARAQALAGVRAIQKDQKRETLAYSRSVIIEELSYWVNDDERYKCADAILKALAKENMHVMKSKGYDL